ncbi:MAG: ABC transporter substrate-binding protein [Clostridiales bacterium]|nr:ABC transporter substrate-binding protein [Clostridiales bacterium]
MNKRLGLVLCMVMLLMIACMPALSEGGIRLVDMEGRTVLLEAAATKVIALNPADCEIVYAIGAEDSLVGRGEYCNYPEAVYELPSVNSGTEMNVEQILALEPQIIIMSKMAQTTDQVDALENAGVRVVISDAQSIEETYTAIEMIGALLGKTQEAETLVSDMKDGFAGVSAAATALDKTVYFEVSPLQWGLWTSGGDTFMDELAQICGLTNAFADVQGWAEVSQEQVIQRNPDFILTTTGYYGEGPLPADEIMSRDGWEGMDAVENGAVYAIDSDSVSRPGPRLVDAAYEIMEFVTTFDTQADAA